MAESAERATKLFLGGLISKNEARRIAGEPSLGADGEVFAQPMNVMLVPAGMATNMLANAANAAAAGGAEPFPGDDTSDLTDNEGGEGEGEVEGEPVDNEADSVEDV
jgi:hypothetical protein